MTRAKSSSDIPHFAPHGMVRFALANDRMSFDQPGEGDIRQEFALIHLGEGQSKSKKAVQFLNY